MFRTTLRIALFLLVPGLAGPVITEATGLSVGAEAEAADFNGRIRRIRIRERVNGTNYSIALDGELDPGFPTVAAMELTFCGEPDCSDAVRAVVPQAELTTVFGSERFAYDGAVAPEGDYVVTAVLTDRYGRAVSKQRIALYGDGEQLRVTRADPGPIGEIDFEVDACGNGSVELLVPPELAAGAVRVTLLDDPTKPLFGRGWGDQESGITAYELGMRGTWMDPQATLDRPLPEAETVQVTVAALDAEGRVLASGTSQHHQTTPGHNYITELTLR